MGYALDEAAQFIANAPRSAPSSLPAPFSPPSHREARGLYTTVGDGGAMSATAWVVMAAGLIAVLVVVARSGVVLRVSPPAPPPYSAPTLSASEYVEFEVWSATPPLARTRVRALDAFGDMRLEDRIGTGGSVMVLSNESIDNLEAVLLSVITGIEPGEVPLLQ